MVRKDIFKKLLITQNYLTKIVFKYFLPYVAYLVCVLIYHNSILPVQLDKTGFFDPENPK